MRFFSFTVLFSFVASSTLPFGSFNRLSLHVAGLNPNARIQHAVPQATTSVVNSLPSKKKSLESTSEPTVEEVCVDQSLEADSSGNVLSHRGGHSMRPTEESLASSAPVKIFGFDISLFGLKLLLQAGLTLINVVCWWLPLSTKSFSQNDNMQGLANSFSAGIFLMLAFSHLIPHSLHTLEAGDINPVYALQATVMGYLLMFAVEKLLFDSHSILHEIEKTPFRRPSIDASFQNITSRPKADNRTRSRSSSDPTVSQQSAVVLLLAMSVHSLFETVALGMAPDYKSALIMATSVALHQPAESLALLVAFLKTSMQRSTIIRWLVLFSVVGPFGVVLGRFIQALCTPFVEGILVAITAGTFIFVSTTDIIPESFEDNVPYKDKWKRFMALVGGIGSILLLGGDDHSH